MFAHPATRSGSRLTFLLDSGGGGVLIGDGAASRLGLAPRQRRIEGALQKTVKLPPLDAGSWIPAPGEALLLEDTPGFMRGADGLLGQSWHDGRVWLFDYPGQGAWTWQGADAPPEAGGSVVPLAFPKSPLGRHRNGFARLAATVDGQSRDFLLDTHLNTGLLPKAVSADAGYFSADNVCTLIDLEIDPFIPPNKIRHTDSRQATAPPRHRERQPHGPPQIRCRG